MQRRGPGSSLVVKLGATVLGSAGPRARIRQEILGKVSTSFALGLLDMDQVGQRRKFSDFASMTHVASWSVELW